MNTFFININKQFLQSRIGDMSQVAGLKRYSFTEGKAKGIEAIDVKTGSGLSFTVLPGRGMDIAWADFKGIPLSYISKAEIVSTEYYELGHQEWLLTFFVGLHTTCGLSNVGGPFIEEHPLLGDHHHGLNGKISNTAAHHVCMAHHGKNFPDLDQRRGHVHCFSGTVGFNGYGESVVPYTIQSFGGSVRL